MAVHGAAAPAHQYASRFLRAARPIARPGAGEHARAARGPVALNLLKLLSLSLFVAARGSIYINIFMPVYLQLELEVGL